ncbi:MAG: inositol monophosphatase family protein [Burkholderiales bacterium]
MPILHPMLTAAVKAARKAGSIMSRATLNLDTITVTTKRKNDFVTEVDKAAEEAIVDIIRKAYPDHGILAEESGASGKSDAEHVWIIDPLDGTTNFIHGFPQYAVSIGVTHKGILAHGVIFDPVKNELFTTSRGKGAYLNDRRIRVSGRIGLKASLIGTGFPFREIDNFDEYMAMFKSVTRETAGIRRAGSAALDLAYVAAGRLDGFWEIGLSPWDVAAGALMIQEAGGLISNLDGDGDFLNAGNVVCGSPKVFTPLLQLVGKHWKKPKHAAPD